MNIENPMVLHQDKYDPQMKPYPTLRCDYCGADVESHHVTEFEGQNICVYCETVFLKDSAEKTHFEGYTMEHWPEYLRWWFGQLSDFEQMKLLGEAYSRQDYFERNGNQSGLADSRIDYCTENEEDFLQYVKEALL